MKSQRGRRSQKKLNARTIRNVVLSTPLQTARFYTPPADPQICRTNPSFTARYPFRMSASSNGVFSISPSKMVTLYVWRLVGPNTVTTAYPAVDLKLHNLVLYSTSNNVQLAASYRSQIEGANAMGPSVTGSDEGTPVRPAKLAISISPSVSNWVSNTTPDTPAENAWLVAGTAVNGTATGEVLRGYMTIEARPAAQTIIPILPA